MLDNVDKGFFHVQVVALPSRLHPDLAWRAQGQQPARILDDNAVMRRQNSRRFSGSVPLVGSSRKRISGSWSSPTAMASLCLNPPGNCPLGDFSRPSRSNCCITVPIRSRKRWPYKP